MGSLKPTLSRISKVLTDRDSLLADEALRRRQSFEVVLICGTDVAESTTLQIAVLTAARLASRCFPGAASAIVPTGVQSAKLLFGNREATLGAALTDILPVRDFDSSIPKGNSIVFGNATETENSVRATFDGWVAAVGPAASTPRMQEREYCGLAGVLVASLAISELFMDFAEVTLLARRRRVVLSLWRPDLPPDAQEALGKPLNVVPSAAWILGLGHLGNAYLWALACLPRNGTARFFLNDFDEVEETNIETGVLFEKEDVGFLKTRIMAKRLEAMGFRTRLLERKFDLNFRPQTEIPTKEPLLAFCGFDSNGARRALPAAGYKFVVESGLGGLANNFDVISMHTLPNDRTADDMWPEPNHAALKQEAEALAAQNPAYSQLTDDVCGRVTVAGQSVGVPFVGTTAAAFVIAEALRLLHGGPAYSQMKLRLATPNELSCRYLGDYPPQAAAGLDYCGL